MIQRSMARGNLKMMPMSTDDKPRVLHKLQGSIHFEKSLPGATAANYDKKHAGLTIPSWFVQKHGDKFGNSAILRTASSTERWPVKLSIWINSPTMKTQVRFGGGWQAFAISHGLLEGDLLIFVLMATSEFKVYVFRSTEGPNKNPTRKQGKRTYYSSDSREKAKQPYRKCKDARLLSIDEEGSDEGQNSSNIESSAVSDGVIAPTSSSCKENSSHHLPSFWKTLTDTNVRGDGLAHLEFPRGFCIKYGNRIRTVVKLQGIHEQSPLRTMACRTSFGKDTRHYLRAEWQDFVTENHLHEGQQLVFTLSADSFFVVRERKAMTSRA